MATLTFSTLTRSTRIVAASRTRLTMPLSRALDAIGVVETHVVPVSGGRGAASCSTQASFGTAQVSGPVQVSRQDQAFSQESAAVSHAYQGKASAAGYRHDHKSITTTNDTALLLDSQKPCGVVDGRGSMKDAFAISLGSRPPSPPAL